MLKVNFNFDPFPILNTSRLMLRRLDQSDLDSILELRSNPETMQFIPRPLLVTKEDALAHLTMIETKINNQNGIDWAICLEGEEKCIGIIGYYNCAPDDLRAEIGYIIMDDYTGNGLITEAIVAVVKYGFDQMQLHSIAAVIDPENYASERVLIKNGFQREGHFRENVYFGGRFWDSVVYSLINK